MKHIYATLALAAAVALAGCQESAGYITGKVRGTGEPVVGTFQSKYDGDQATASLNLNVLGQHYSGTIVPIGAGSISAVNFGSAWVNGQSINTDGYSYGYQSTSSFGAMLQGNRGGMMRCDLNTTEPGTFKSGMGTCQTSDDQVIDLVWSPDEELELKIGIDNRPSNAGYDDATTYDDNEY